MANLWNDLSVNTRFSAFRILKTVLNGGYLQVEINKLTDLNDRDYSFISFLTKGILREKIWLERIIALYSNKPLDKIDDETMIFLYIGLYQILKMESVPEHAAVNETIDAMKRSGLHRSSGFVNGILRETIRRPPVEQLYSNLPEKLSISYSYPLWLIERWTKQFGTDELEKLLASMNRFPGVGVLVNRFKTDRDKLSRSLQAFGFDVVASDLFDDMLIVQGGRLTATAAFRNGEFYIQDQASRLVGKIASIYSEGQVLDVAAAPGGKSINLLQDGIDVISSDINIQRLSDMRNNLIRMGLNSRRIMVMDASKSLPFIKKFPLILIDTPCSSSGRIRRTPELKYRIDPERLKSLAELQFRLLFNLSSYVSDGGYLIYATCSIDSEENVSVVRRFLEATDRFEVIDPSDRLPLKFHRFIEDNLYVRTSPVMDDMDGFFVAILKKVDR